MTAGAHARAEALGLRLDGLEDDYAQPDASGAMFVSHVAVGDLLYLSGTVPLRDGVAYLPGVVGVDLDIETAQEAARSACGESLRVLSYALGWLERVRRVVHMTGFVNSGPDFHEQSRVVNGATELLVEVFGPVGLGTRAAIGCRGLAMNSSVEVVLVVQYEGNEPRPGLMTPAARARTATQ